MNAADQTNYTVSKNDGTLAIGKATLTVTGNSANVTYNGTNQTVDGYVVSGLLGSDTAADLVGISASGATGKNAGVYTNAVNAADQTNYTVSKSDGKLIIGKRDLVLAAVTNTKTYDGNVSSNGSVLLKGLVGSDSVTGATQSFDNKNVLGTDGSTLRVNDGYTVNDGNGGNNYKVTTTTASGTVTPKSATVTATGARKVFTGLQQSLDPATSSGFLAGDQITITGLATGSAPGQYASDLKATGADARNYSVSYQNATLEILPVSNSVNPQKSISSINVSPQTRIAYRGFSASGAAVGGKNAAIAEPNCTPETDSNCVCEVNREFSLEICLPVKDRTR